MLSRTDFIDLEKDLKMIKIFELKDIYFHFDRFLTYLNSSKNNYDTEFKIGMIQKSESKAKEILQIIVGKINPDINWLIRIENNLPDSNYKKFRDCVDLIMKRIEEEKARISNILSNQEKMQSNRITNKMAIESYSDYLHEIVNDLVYNPLKEAVLRFILLDKEDFVESVSEGKIRITGDNGIDIAQIEKDKNLFWFFVFCFMFRSSQILGYSPQVASQYQKTEIKDLRKIISIGVQMELQRMKKSEEIKKNMENKTEDKAGDSKHEEKQKENDTYSEDIPENIDDENEDYSYGEDEEHDSNEL